MPATLTTRAVERSTYIVTAEFKDASGASVVPNSIAWTLSDEQGRTMNSRSAVAVAVPAASIDIVLSDADLALTGAGDKGGRVLTIVADYDSTEGAGLPLHEKCASASIRF
jgi:hypothetical protein